MKRESVRKWMTPNPVTIGPDMSLVDAHTLFQEHDIRRLPVVDEDEDLVGIITLGDVREASPSDANNLSMWELNYLLTKMKVERVMSSDPLTVYATDTVATAASLMLENKVSGLPVVDVDGKLVGVVTESDIFRLVVQNWEEE